MKRKIIELGNGCLVVSIPAKYARKHLLRKGDELQLAEEGNDLRLSKGRTESRPVSYFYDVGQNERIGRRVIPAAYRLGVSELRLSYRNPNYFESIQKTLLEQTIGFEVVKQEHLSCTIKDLSKPAVEEFDNTVQRCWSLLIDIANETLDGIKRKDYDLLKSMYLKDKAVNKFAHYTMRMLMQGSPFSQSKTISYYHFFQIFEELSDEYQDLAVQASAQRLVFGSNHIAILEELNVCIKNFSAVFGKFDDASAEQALNAVVDIHNRLNRESFDRRVSFAIPYYLMSICRRIRNIMAAIVELNTCDRLCL
ncbi:AbrB/MazE/SpoVT family DNA-binding domain-containing protein [Candidatus Woesearchaeota archaeon]|nr:AbrB/MazE/SpoVT family DNA-binding domain-containing protein [Candidatus Woesearchaeota archaeon]